MPGTNVWSVIFVCAALIVAIVILAPLINMWRRYVADVKDAFAKKSKQPSWVGPMAVSCLACGAFVVSLTLGWNAMVNETTSRSNYKAPAEIQEQKKVQEAQTPSVEEMDAARAEHKQRAQSKPHKDALDTFDDAMKREEEKIKQRSIKKTEKY